MIIDVPTRDEHGNVKFMHTLNEEQVQALLQFAIGFLLSAGLAATYGIVVPDQSPPPTQLND